LSFGFIVESLLQYWDITDKLTNWAPFEDEYYDSEESITLTNFENTSMTKEKDNGSIINISTSSPEDSPQKSGESGTIKQEKQEEVQQEEQEEFFGENPEKEDSRITAQQSSSDRPELSSRTEKQSTTERPQPYSGTSTLRPSSGRSLKPSYGGSSLRKPREQEETLL